MITHAASRKQYTVLLDRTRKRFLFFVKIRHRAPLTSYTEKKGVGTCCGRKEEK